NHQAFRAAFVEACFDNPFQLVERDGGVDFVAAGTYLGRADAAGHLRLSETAPSLPHVLGPSNLAGLAQAAYGAELDRIRVAYCQRSGLDVTISDTRGGYLFSRKRALQGLAATAVKAFCARLEPEGL